MELSRRPLGWVPIRERLGDEVSVTVVNLAYALALSVVGHGKVWGKWRIIATFEGRREGTVATGGDKNDGVYASEHAALTALDELLAEISESASGRSASSNAA